MRECTTWQRPARPRTWWWPHNTKSGTLGQHFHGCNGPSFAWEVLQRHDHFRLGCGRMALHGVACRAAGSGYIANRPISLGQQKPSITGARGLAVRTGRPSQTTSQRASLVVTITRIVSPHLNARDTHIGLHQATVKGAAMPRPAALQEGHCNREVTHNPLMKNDNAGKHVCLGLACRYNISISVQMGKCRGCRSGIWN